MQAAILGLVEGRRLRRLGMQETLWHEVFTRQAGAGLVVYSLVLDSDRRLEPSVVHSALEALQRQFPLLRARVEHVDGAGHLVAGPCPDVPLTVLPPSDDWLAEHNRQVREQTIDTATGPLWKASLMTSPTDPVRSTTEPSHRAVVHFSFCHTITDGPSNGLLLGRLIENLDRLATGREPDVSNPAHVSPCMDEFVHKERVKMSPGLVRDAFGLLRFFVRRRQHPFLDRFVAPFDPARAADGYWNQMLPEVLSREESQQLRATCRRHGVTVNAALSAAVSLAAARLLADSSSSATFRPFSLPTVWLVNLRRYLPEIRGAQLSAICGAPADVRVDSIDGKDFWQLAGRIGSRLNDQLEHRLPLVLMKLVLRFMKPEKTTASMEDEAKKSSSQSKMVYNINNMGSLDTVFPKTTHVRAVELHRTFRAHPATDHSFGSHCFQTVGGRLCYDLNFIRGRVAEEDAKRYSKEVLQTIREAIKVPDGGTGR